MIMYGVNEDLYWLNYQARVERWDDESVEDDFFEDDEDDEYSEGDEVDMRMDDILLDRE